MFDITLERVKKLEKIKADLQLRNSLIVEQASIYGSRSISLYTEQGFLDDFNEQFKQYLTIGDSND